MVPCSIRGLAALEIHQQELSFATLVKQNYREVLVLVVRLILLLLLDVKACTVDGSLSPTLALDETCTRGVSETGPQ